jgi:dTDP-4-amino-4,6-dideoxy-D-galactose acyltransferase
MRKLFVIDKNRNDDYSKELLCAFEKISASEGKAESISLDQLDSSIEGKDVVISNGLIDEWHNKLKRLGCVSIVFDALKEFAPLADIVIDHRANNKSANYGTEQYSLTGNPKFDFNAVADLVKKLSWDTDFWGLGYGQIKSKTLTENVYHKVEHYARANDIKFLEFLCDADDQQNIFTAEKLGFHLGDIRITFDVKGKRVDMEPLPEGMHYGIAEERHIDELKRISKDLYKISRYYYDGHFDKQKVSEFYNAWVEKAVRGTFDHICYCVFEGDKPIGFATFRYLTPGNALFGLGAFSNEYQGLQLGRKLFRHVININAEEKGITYVTSTTQGRNYMTQRMHQSIDFRTASIELWFHKWL